MLFKGIYRVLTSLKTSIWILAGMLLCYVIGTIFPQGADFNEYADAEGRFLFMVEKLSLLNIFTSPIFIVLSSALCINLFFCILERLRKVSRRRDLIPHDTLLRNPNLVDAGPEKRFADIEKMLLGMRFRLIAKDEKEYVYGKGAPYWWLSWIYHLGIIVAIAGFLTTALTAHEGYLTLWPGEEKSFSLYSPDTRLNMYLKRFGQRNVPLESGEIPDREYSIKLNQFSTEYYQSLRFDYPESGLSRLSLALGWKSIKPAKDIGLSAKMWKTDFRVMTPEYESVDAEVWVNHPFRHKGLTLYQMGYEQKMTLLVDEISIPVETYREFEVPGIDGSFTAKTVKQGTVYRKDGTTDSIRPGFDLLFQPAGSSRKEKLGVVYLDNPTIIKDQVLNFTEFVEGSVLSYRIDRGVTLIAVSTLLVFLGLVFRSYAYWYRIRIISDNGRLMMAVSTRGLLARKERVLKRLGVTAAGRLEGFLGSIRERSSRYHRGEMK